ncbi:hypothetical protein L0O83_18080 [Lawsonibacter sp. DFI.5.51]|nr:hypothetical protein [Lawsonibacter sp. DFI.5.51]
MGKTTAGPPFLDKTLWEQTLRLKPRRGENIMKKAIALLLTFVTLLSYLLEILAQNKNWALVQ